MSHILSDLSSGDAHRIWSGAWGIRDLHDLSTLRKLASHLDEIRAKTAEIALGGVLRANASHLEFALRKLEFARDSSACLCHLYREDDLISPEREEEAAAIRILDRVLKNGCLDYYRCECLHCGKRYHVEERDYHYTWWKWEEVIQPPVPTRGNGA